MHLAMCQKKPGVPIWHQTCFSFSILPSCNSFREKKTQQHKRAEKEDNDKDMKNGCLIMLQILSLFHISSLSLSLPREITGICFILKVD